MVESSPRGQHTLPDQFAEWLWLWFLEDGTEVPDNGKTLYLSSTQAGAVTPNIPNFQENTVVVVGKVLTGKLVLDITQSAVGGGGAQAGGAPAVAPPGDDI